ncbi:MAG: hypothetical protein R2867_16170 [Caldilineaceae bacterium]
MSRVLRELDRAQVSFLLTSVVQLLADALPADLAFGQEISLRAEHILAWVTEQPQSTDGRPFRQKPSTQGRPRL